MLSVLITSYKEPRTIGKAIECFLPQIGKDDEILIAAPDKETIEVISGYAKKDKRIKLINDAGKGKPAALNMLFVRAKGDIWILSDGDVYVDEHALRYLLEPFHNQRAGAVTGRPISISPRKTILGYWSHLLTDVGAHQTRLRAVQKGCFFVCSGYLYAVRKGTIRPLPENALSDDAVISTQLWLDNWKIAYAPQAMVYVRYPTTFRDWFMQKRRSAGGYTQLRSYFQNPPIMRSFTRELIGGMLSVWTYPTSPREIAYTALLFPMRLYLWLRIYWDIVIKKSSMQNIWQRVESTK